MKPTKINENINTEFLSWVNEYDKIVKELIREQNKVSKTSKLSETKYKLKEELTNKNEKINATKEELKQKNPSYARAQQRFIEQQKTKNMPNSINQLSINNDEN
ncbi:hypothetical protein OC716_01885 [Candidatus Phytoplasma aurantifolia]|uniref:Uncharacterized protein n=1 Tax=Candidatus Phytoplasma citri TaxID=180978 RepID=A0A1S9M400_9MOLU|nr:hypothetical protein [Candidatus Phytoplasma aurantifolia]MDO8078994.1 hypothetical protein [Candidatus Phytoplasma aurantifolia]OOP59998.1 hypothetical protein B2G44_00365 [Candidatus Phytoplasma aurantifolia]